jgi:putative ABC transport system permease protein
MRLEHWLFMIPLRLRSLFRRAQADQELDDELRDHLERKIEEYVAKGMTTEEAQRRAIFQQFRRNSRCVATNLRVRLKPL